MTVGPSEMALRAWLCEAIRDISGASAAIDAGVRFRELGLGSMQVIELVARLSTHVARPLAQTLAWEYPTPAALAGCVAREIDGARTLAAPSGMRTPLRAQGSNEPIAVVGMACRLPAGVDSPQAFWRMLIEKRHGIREVPIKRWDVGATFDEDAAAPGKASTRWGGFIDGVDLFDAAFFGISPREARQLDPQQRLMLELAWEALEDAATNPLTLRERAIGVFVGAMWNDYASFTNSSLHAMDQHTAPGVDLSILSGRISYQLGLQGPSLTVNTACSSSLVAIHLACRSIRSGESDLALAGGVSLMLSPSGHVAMSKFGAMNPAGQCRAFDAGANGYVRGEGAGLVVLKPLSRAIADGDRIYCVVRGSALNNDGFSNGLTAPNPRAQEAVLAQACADASVDPASIAYIEAHGPGTILGDPIEAGAIAAVFGKHHSTDRPLRIGSVKTNIGHLEPASGVAGLIKTALALQHGVWPASLNFDAPNPRIAFDAWHLKVQTVAEQIRNDGAARAGVSSFGFGGTNCHVVLEAVDERGSMHILPLSAASRAQYALRVAELARAFARTTGPRDEFELCRAIAAEASNGGPFRKAIVARPGEMGAALAAAGTFSKRSAARPQIVFVFPGQGAQWFGMARWLLASEPVFRTEIEACDRIVQRLRGWSLLDELVADESASRVGDVEVLQIVLFSMMVSFAALWRSLGVTPDVVVGHSLGEIAAAYVAGALSREAALLIVAERGRLVRERAQDRGAMLLVGAAEGALTELLQAQSDLEIAAFNAPASLILAGPIAAIEAAHMDLVGRGIKSDRVQVRYGSHCAQMEPLIGSLREVLGGITPRKARVRMRSTLRDAWLSGEELDGDYWCANLRSPVLFRQVITAIAAEGPAVFVELSPQPVLAKAIEHTAGSIGRIVEVLASLRRGESARETLLRSLGALFEAGLCPDWQAALSDDGRPRRPTNDTATSIVPIILSGRTEAAVRAQAERLRAHLEARPDLSLLDVAYSLVSARAQFEHRAAAVARTRSELLGSLAAIGHGESAPSTVVERCALGGKVVFVFPGHGSQWEGMARSLLDTAPAFRTQIEACEHALAPYVDWSLLAVLRGESDAPPLERIDVVQPVLFSVMVSLAALWRASGLNPDAVVGHSFGEIAAAYVAGALSLEDASKIIALRGQVLAPLADKGGMLAVELGLDAVQTYLAPFGARLCVGVENSPNSNIVSGDADALDALSALLTTDRVRAQRVRIGFAAHSPHVERVGGEFLAQLAAISPRPTEIPIYSTVSGSKLDPSELDAGYWYRNLRQTVRFADATSALLADAHRFFIEVSPHSVLTPAVLDSCESSSRPAAISGTLLRERGELEHFVFALSALYCRGCPLDLGSFFGELQARRIALPPYAFQREPYWLAAPTYGVESSAGAPATDHPLLGVATAVADGSQLFTGSLSLAQQPWLADHVVFGHVLLPGTVFLELALAAGQRFGCDRVDELTLEVPLELPRHGGVTLQLALSPTDHSGRRTLSFHAHALGAPADARWIRHATATLSVAEATLDFDLRAWPPVDAVPLEVDYRALAARGLAYGPAFQALHAAWRRGDEVFADVRLPETQRATAGDFVLHPILVDAALHALSLETRASDGVPLPFCLSGVAVRAAGARGLRVRFRGASRDNGMLSIADGAGEPIGQIAAFSSRPCTAPRLRRAARAQLDTLLRVEWSEQPTASPIPKAKRGVLLRMSDIELPASIGFERFSDLAALQDALDQGTPAPDLVVAPFFGKVPDPDVRAAAHHVTARALALVQRWISDTRLAPAALVIVTCRAVSTRPDEDIADLACATLSGLMRSTLAEYPEAAIFLVDCDQPLGSRHALNVLLGSLDSAQRVFALREGRRLLPRLTQLRADDALVVPEAAAWRLHSASKGSFDALTLVADHAAEHAPLGSGQVRIAVRAAGLNFRDVLDALGSYPGDPGPLGIEGAGVITAIGSGVHGFAVGDRVMGLFPAAFGPVAVADARMLVQLPAGWSFSEGASAPVIFLTAYYGLLELGQLSAGQRVLIHAAAGGVGSAAVQFAQHLGAEVFATASPGKHGALRALGFDDDHIASSRDLDFEQHFLRSTGGRGVDVVLDCLAREFVDASLRLIPHAGRFIELGKSDIRDPAGVTAAHPGVSYRAFDLFEAGPDQIASMFAKLAPLFECGVLRPPPITRWDVRLARQSFQALAQAKHVGKFVLTLPRPVQRGGTVLITGGTGTLGARVARHLVTTHGRQHLVLASREGANSAGAERLRSELEAAGASVAIVACDVGERAALAALIAGIPAERPLVAIVHAAGTVDDGVLQALTPERIDRVFHPKLDAAWHLHELSAGHDLEAFVLFSSALGVLGAAGQANYAAANAFLDALAQHRKARGLPGAALAWGLWADRSGITSHLSAADTARLSRTGLSPISTELGLTLFDAALERPEAALVSARFDFRGLAASDAVHPMLQGLVRQRRPRGQSALTHTASFLERLRRLDAAGRTRAVLDLVHSEAAYVLGLSAPAPSLEPSRSFKQLGFDSLMAVELRNRIARATGLRFEANLMFDHPTPAAVCDFIATRLFEC